MTYRKKSPTWSACPIIFAAANTTIPRQKEEKSYWRSAWKKSNKEKKTCDAQRKAAPATKQNLRNEEGPTKQSNWLFPSNYAFPDYPITDSAEPSPMLLQYAKVHHHKNS